MENILNRNFWRHKKVLVTGHTGFKGTWLLHMLAELEANVFGIAKAAEKYNDIYNLTKSHDLAQSHFLDISDFEALNRAISKIYPEIIAICLL